MFLVILGNNLKVNQRNVHAKHKTPCNKFDYLAFWMYAQSRNGR